MGDASQKNQESHSEPGQMSFSEVGFRDLRKYQDLALRTLASIVGGVVSVYHFLIKRMAAITNSSPITHRIILVHSAVRCSIL
jgi:hypothetical protein